MYTYMYMYMYVRDSRYLIIHLLTYKHTKEETAQISLAKQVYNITCS